MTRKELLTSDEYIIAFLDCAVRSDKSSKSIRKEVAEKWLSYRDELIEMFKPTPSVSAEDFRKQIFSHLNSLPYAGGYPGDWHETLANHLSTYFASRKPAGIRWVKDKPVNDKEFVMVTASLIKDRWDYQAWELVEIPGEGYYGLCQFDGEEWGPYEDLKADLYLVLPHPTHAPDEYSLDNGLGTTTVYGGKSAGPIWVKASERHAELGMSVSLKIHGRPGFGKFYEGKGGELEIGFEASNGYGTLFKHQFEDVFWLDESATEQTSAGQWFSRDQVEYYGKQILKSISDTFLKPDNLAKASFNDQAVIQAVGKTILNFPLPEPPGSFSARAENVEEIGNKSGKPEQ